jgi:putative ABC transport system permease protein
MNEPWEAATFRAWLRLLGTKLTRAFEEELVVLFQDRLDEVGSSTWRRVALLVRCAVDAARHVAADGIAGAPSARSARVSTGKGGGMESMYRDTRFALRSLARRPMFAAIAVSTLALGIGGTTAMFSVVDGVLIKDLPYEEPATLVSVWKAWPSWRDQDGLDYVWDHIQFPWEDYLSVREQVPSLSRVGAYQNDDQVLYGRGSPTPVSTGLASANLFDLLGVRPLLGRTFSLDEVPPEGEPARVVILSHEIWEGRFGRATDVLGQTARLDDEVYEVIGVLPDRFRLSSDLITTHENGGAVDDGLRDVWLPLGSDGVDCGNCFELIGRLAPGRTLDDARSQVQAAMTYRPAPEDQVARVVPRKDVVTRGFGTPLLVLLAAAGLLLLIACTNVAGLLIGEASGRQREIAVRAALGARRSRIVRQLLTESLLLGVAGASAGLAVALVGTDMLLSVAPPLPRLEEVGVSTRVLAFAAGAGLMTGLLFGLAPTLSLGRHSGDGVLRARGEASGNRLLQSTIVSVQVALTVVLLVAGGLFGRSLTRVMAVDPGFDPERVATMGVAIPPGRPAEHDDAQRFYGGLMDVLSQIPGVDAVSVTSVLPFPGGTNSHSFMYERGGEDLRSTQWARWVAPSYFEALGIPLIRGRLLNDRDVIDAPGAMLVSESLARRNWPDGSALGARVRYFGRDWSVVGVVGDVRQKALGSPPEATFYVSTGQLSRRSMDVVARTAGDAADAMPALREAIWSFDPDIPISAPATMTELVRASEADDRFRALLMWTFAAWAVVLASVGLFGVTARAVGSRSRELGIRSALGARSSSLIRLVVRDGVASSLAGTALGIVGAYWLSSLIGHLLYEVDSHDPVTFAGATGLSVIVCLAAAYTPARRVTAIAPMEVISEE